MGSDQEVQIVSEFQLAHHFGSEANSIECAKRWQQSLDPDLDRSEWREEEVSSFTT